MQEIRQDWLESFRDEYEEKLPLDSARTAFGWLVTGPQPLGVNGRQFEGLPNRHVPMDELRAWLMSHEIPGEVRDAVWAYLIQRSRRDGGAWTVACVGMVMPSLAAHARWLGARYRGERADVHAAVLSGFIRALATIDLADPGVMKRLIWRAWEAGKVALAESLCAPLPIGTAGFHSTPPPPPHGHPDLVLARAVEEGVLTATEAELISATRLGDEPLTDWGSERGIRYWAVRKMRQRAEGRLVSWLSEQRAESDTDDPVGDVAAAATRPIATAASEADQPEKTRTVTGRRPGRRSTVSKKSSRTVSKNGPELPLLGCGEIRATSPRTAVAREMPEVRRCA